jgi:tetraacyldisaccharide-1-P 4'-kinase
VHRSYCRLALSARLLTTEKDAVKVAPYVDAISPPVYALRVRMELVEGTEELERLIEGALKTHQGS